MRIISKLILGAALSLSLGQAGQAQRGVCGVNHADQDHMVNFVSKVNLKRHQGALEQRSLETVYVPLAFRRVGEGNGSGRVKMSGILNQLLRLNRDYTDVGMHFYFHELPFTEIDNSFVYDTPGSQGGFLDSNKESDAVNIYVTRDASTNSSLGGVTLGYYSPSGDYIVCRLDEVQDTSNTLSHELGHYFSLPHTHRGWDNQDYEAAVHGNPLATPYAPSGGLAELASGSNCESSADRMCDTPADYNFGFSNGNCRWNKTSKNIKDYEGELLDPMAENQMGYFSDCSQYVFTPMQIETMMENYISDRREYIRTGYVPVHDEITEQAVVTSPENRADLEYYDNIVIDWDPVQGATHYVIEMTTSGSSAESLEWIVSENQLVIEELSQNTTYRYRVYPFNEGNASTASPKLYRFTTGSRSTAIDEVEEIDFLNFYPNPVGQGQDIFLSIDANNRFEAEVAITALDGSKVWSRRETFAVGGNALPITLNGLSSGIYIASIKTESGISQKKIIIQ